MEESHELVGYRLEPAGPDTDTLAAYLTLNDPERRNALSDALLDQLTELLQRAATDSRVRVIVLTSSHPRIFSSGGNLDAFADDRATIAKYAGLSRFPALYRTLTGIDRPVVCLSVHDLGIDLPRDRTAGRQ